MASTARPATELSHHPSLDDGEIEETQSVAEEGQDQQQGKQENNKKAKEPPSKSKKFSVVEAARIAGGVAIAGISWAVPKSKRFRPNRFKVATVAAVVATTKPSEEKYSIASGLQPATAVAFAGIAWVPHLHVKRPDKYSIGPTPVAGTPVSMVEKYSTGRTPVPETPDGDQYSTGRTPVPETPIQDIDTFSTGQTPAPETPDQDVDTFSTGMTPVPETPAQDIDVFSTGQTPAPQTPALEVDTFSTGQTPAPETPAQDIDIASTGQTPVPETPAVPEIVDTASSPILELLERMLRPTSEASIPYGRGETPMLVVDTVEVSTSPVREMTDITPPSKPDTDKPARPKSAAPASGKPAKQPSPPPPPPKEAWREPTPAAAATPAAAPVQRKKPPSPKASKPKRKPLAKQSLMVRRNNSLQVFVIRIHLEIDER